MHRLHALDDVLQALELLSRKDDGNGRVGVVANRRLRILVRLAHVGDDANGHLVQHLHRRLVDLEAERRLPQLFRELELHVLRVGGAAGTQRTRQVLDLDEEGDTVVLRLALHHVVEEHRLLRARKRARATAAAWWARRGRVRVAARRRGGGTRLADVTAHVQVEAVASFREDAKAQQVGREVHDARVGELVEGLDELAQLLRRAEHRLELHEPL